jgi:peptidoglycan hydrolase-like protein with peptidoglycan-binding domain
MLLLAVGIAVAVADPFATQASRAAPDHGAQTAMQTVQRRSLTARQPVTGTLGYASVWTVAVPAGASTAELQQADQQEASARRAYLTAQASLAGDVTTLATVQAELQAARLREASDCAGTNAASAAPTIKSPPPNSADSALGTSPCASSIQAAQTAQDVVAAAQPKVAADRAELTAAQVALTSARRALDEVRSASATYGSTATYTSLPTPGEVIRRGRTLYSINGADTILLYGSMPAWRTLAAGVPAGRDVAELNANLRALGLDSGVGDSFTSSTEQAIKIFQRKRGLPTSGSLPLGSVVFEPGAVRVTAVTPTVGQSVQPGPIMTLSSTRHAVSIQLDVSQQSQVEVGDRVAVTLPDNHNTPGVVASVGKVATVSSASGGATPGSPSILVRVRLLRPEDAGTLDQAPVNVLITTASVDHALVVPVNALVALAGGGYALEEVFGKDQRKLVRVTPGLFDDEQGLVQVKGPGVAAGQRVVVPAQ